VAHGDWWASTAVRLILFFKNFIKL
jgi:hypothetical protein